jgi:hypothetical protein
MANGSGASARTGMVLSSGRSGRGDDDTKSEKQAAAGGHGWS